MRILVTGVSGFVGRLLAARLIAQGHELWGLDLNLEATPDGVHSAEWDLTQTEGLADLLAQIHPEAVAHLAAQASPAAALADPAATFDINVGGSFNLFEAMRSAIPEARLLFISSSEVYGPSDHPHLEDETPAPTGPYGASKATAEIWALQAWRAWKQPVIVARSFPHSGPGQRPDFALPAFARQIARVEAGLQDPVIRVGNLEARRDWLAVEDVVDVYLGLIERGQPGEIYNVCSGIDHSVREALDYLVGRAKIRTRIEIDPALLRPVDLPRLSGDAGKLRNSLNWEPKIDFAAMLDGLLAYWRDRVNEEELR